MAENRRKVSVNYGHGTLPALLRILQYVSVSKRKKEPGEKCESHCECMEC